MGDFPHFAGLACAPARVWAWPVTRPARAQAADYAVHAARARAREMLMRALGRSRDTDG